MMYAKQAGVPQKHADVRKKHADVCQSINLDRVNKGSQGTHVLGSLGVGFPARSKQVVETGVSGLCAGANCMFLDPGLYALLPSYTPTHYPISQLFCCFLQNCVLFSFICVGHGNSLPHVAIHIPAESLYLAPSNTAGHKHHEQQQQQQEQQPALLMKSPALLKLVLHEMGHAISMILSAHSAPSSVFGNVGFASTDVQELSAHVLERWDAGACFGFALTGVEELSAHVSRSSCVRISSFDCWVCVDRCAGALAP
eukprot:scaffold18629_cov15-Tisochrysis_lutea.AAC.1